MPHAIVYEWVQAENGEFPPNAVKVGYDSGNVVYVARAKHMGDNIPGKFLPVYGLCYVPWGGREHEYDEYEVLTDPHGSTFEWAYSNGSDIPAGTVQGGNTANNEPLFIGRVSHNGAMCSGKVRPSDGILYVPYGGIEHQYEIFEYLVRRETL